MVFACIFDFIQDSADARHLYICARLRFGLVEI